MPRQKYDLNTVYITERLSESLCEISRSSLTTIVAPMGYGKTTAVNWFLDGIASNVIRINVYSDNPMIFWKSAQDAFERAGFDLLRDYTCPVDSAGGALLADDLCHELADCYIFIDDFHLLTDEGAVSFICVLANRLPPSVHLIIASRDRFLPPAEILRLGARLCQIGTEQLKLDRTELTAYARRSGITLPDELIDSLLYSSEGWFSAIYLSLRAFIDNGSLPDSDSDIYSTFKAALIDPLCEAQREFLAVMGLADEFTTEMAAFITRNSDSSVILSALTAQNAFVKRLPDGSYRFHHMMKDCAKKAFLTLEPEKQRLYLGRYGSWYNEHKLYLHAMSAYRQSNDFDSLLRTVELDAGILLSSLRPDEVLNALDTCPVGILKAHPTALLVLMRSMFNWHKIPKMLELKSLLLTAIDENKLTKTERGDLLGECDLIMSFLCYNDISAMSKLHRSASAQMSRPAISIRNNGGWTFGSPSVLMMFYRAPGELESELCEMDECMPHYYRITNHHGQGAEKLMRAEAAFMRGNLTDAHIGLERAYADIEGNGQENMLLCCDFLADRLSLHTDIKPKAEQAFHNSAWINLSNAVKAYFHAINGETEKIPEIYREHRLDSVNVLAPGKPMIAMIENQVCLAEGDYAKVIGRAAGQISVCEAMRYALVKLHVDIQTASAYSMLGKPDEADKILKGAIEAAKPDHLVMPFVENYRYIKKLIKEDEFTNEIIALAKAAEKRRATRPERFSELTDREYELVKLMNERLSNREIAERLFLSEGSVKQYTNQIYSKLGIEGDIRTKRRRLLELLTRS